MRHYGFSTGAIAKDDVVAALECLSQTNTTAVELSALRLSELDGLLRQLSSLNLDQFTYCSFHAPSRFDLSDEDDVIHALQIIKERKWPIIIHPDTIHSPAKWRHFGSLLLIENMDQRKPIGRTADELDEVFEQLPEAKLCFDLGHARQVDSSMTEAYRIIKRHGDRIREVHISEVDSSSIHRPLNVPALTAFMRVAPLINRSATVILEPMISCAEVPMQLLMVQMLFETADLHRWKHAQSHHITWYSRPHLSGLSVEGVPLRVNEAHIGLIRLLENCQSPETTETARWQYFGRSFFPAVRIGGVMLDDKVWVSHRRDGETYEAVQVNEPRRL